MKIHPLLTSLLLLPVFLPAACMHTPADHPVNLQLSNDGDAALQCKIVYGHWVERDLGTLAAGTTFDIAMRQQEGRSCPLHSIATDMQRRMMIENIRLRARRPTGTPPPARSTWHATRARAMSPILKPLCAAPAGPGRVAATSPISPAEE